MRRGPIRRDLVAAIGRHHDLIIVGGGIYGIMLALEAARRRLRPLLIERRDFAGATSYNSLRILHGGLRYLQSMNLRRALLSIAERRWWLEAFPELVQPLPCLMPLYDEGLRRRPVLRLALAANDLLGRWEGRGRGALPAGRMLDPADVIAIFPQVDRRGLRGGGLWHDAFVPNAQRLCMEALRWACAEGGLALNYVEAVWPIDDGARIRGLGARDAETGHQLEFRTDAVINAAGPWSRRVAAACNGDAPQLFEPMLAWNVVFRRAALADHAVAVRPRRPGGQTYFLVPWKGALLAGTGYARWHGESDGPQPSAAQVDAFVRDLNEAVPGLELQEGEIAQVFAGLLPARQAGSEALADQAVIVDHGRQGGLAGMFSVSGVKLTVARAVAEQVLRRAFPHARPVAWPDFRRASRPVAPDPAFAWTPEAGGLDWQGLLREAIASEAVCHLDDLLLRRSSLGDDPARALALAPAACALLGWDEVRTGLEIERLRRQLGASSGCAAAPGEGGAGSSRRGASMLACDAGPDAPSMMPT